ncbi:MAG: endonuclease/exonuclease/phosphatase family protein [Bacteroidota bacterium]
MTFNIFHGETMNGNFDLNRIANVINNEKPDLVALQEVDFKTKRVNYIDLADSIAKRTNMFATFGKAMDYDNGAYGVAILSKKRILDSRNISLPHGKNEPRTALEITTILSSGDTISFINTHLDHKQKDHYRLCQAKTINNSFMMNKFPTILAGDLNDIPESITIKLLEKYWISTYNKENPKPTYPSSNPERKIDYIFFSPNTKWQLISNKVIDNSIASDHRAYLVKIKLIR